MVVARTEKENKDAITQLRSQLKGYPAVTDEVSHLCVFHLMSIDIFVYL
jgi:hypothetical protein